ncbi:SMI1/KNR4 family protein [Serratia rubidaea]|uniref:SMI1/KNR4 family protein n=1 Tax=Serratia rubidaea TaxID=61652 RepID=A0ABS0MBK3_SERRU|nr:SMI1/KNR4 family protein [Serratia rubidaea]MBH1929751.1 SMI1/KNR4 family protein [Serratia rubidaea]MDC6118509.1 SMI1/KNR4 family protein [Serratia rubidaea]MEB7587305.1 SMI1/KNR4 family protein [Serratia rubidaea]
MKHIHEIEREIQSSGEEFFSVGPIERKTIEQYENLLGLEFPVSYKNFLMKYGSLSFCGDTYYGITTKGIEKKQVPCVLFVTEQARDAGDISPKMIKIKSSGYGLSYSIDTETLGKEGEAVIVETQLSFKRDGVKKIIADNYGEFLLNQIKEAIEDI